MRQRRGMTVTPNNVPTQIYPTVYLAAAPVKADGFGLIVRVVFVGAVGLADVDLLNWAPDAS